MDEEVAIVAQHPFALFVPFHAVRQFAAFLELQADFVDYGLVLACIGAGADDEIVSETGDCGQIQDADVGGLLCLRGADGNSPPWFNFLFFNIGGDNACFGLRQNSPPTAIVL